MDQKKEEQQKTKNQTHIFVFLEIFEREGGIQSYVKDVLKAYLSNIENKPYQAEVFLLRDGEKSDNPFEGKKGIKFHYFKTSIASLGRIKLIWNLLKTLITQKPTLVFCGHIKLSGLIKILCQPLQIPYIVLTYGKEVWQPLSKLQRNALEEAKQIWTISRYSRDQLVSANEIDPKLIEILPCIVDENKFTPGIKPTKLMEKYQLENTKVIMTVARLWSGDIYKGVDVTIRALPKILEVFPEVKYLVIGRGDDKPRLEKLAKDLNIANRVIFAGFIPTEELVDCYRVADAYIMPSQEGFGIVYLEAMACGKPVLSGDKDGSADPLDDGRLGWQVPHRNPEAVTKACIEILQGEDKRCDGQWLRQECMAKFGQNALKEKLELLLNKLSK